MNMSGENATKENRNSIDKHACEIARVTTLPLMNHTMVRARTFCGGIQLVRSHEHLVQKRVDLVAQSIVDTVPGIPFVITIANLSLLCPTLPKDMKVAMCTASPQSWFRERSTADEPDTFNPHKFIKLLN